MALEIRQLHHHPSFTGHFVGEVSGVDLTQPLTPDEAAAIDAGMDKYAVLVFHGQQRANIGFRSDHHFNEFTLLVGHLFEQLFHFQNTVSCGVLF